MWGRYLGDRAAHRVQEEEPAVAGGWRCRGDKAVDWGGRGVCLGGSGPRPALPHPRHALRCLEDCGHGVCSGPPDFTCVCDLGWTSDLPPPTPAPGPPAPRCSRDCGCNFHSHCRRRGPGFCDECQGERPQGPSPGLQCPSSAWASGSPRPARGPCPMGRSRPHTVSVPPISLAGARSASPVWVPLVTCLWSSCVGPGIG